MLKVVGASWLQTKISTYILAGMGILAVVAIFFGDLSVIEDDGNYSATVYWSTKAGFRIEFWGHSNELKEVPLGAARAYYRSDIKETGWSKLEIESDGSYPDWVQAYAAGVLEGALTWQMIHWQWQNTIEKRCDKYPDDCKKIRDLLKDNMDAVRTRSISNEDTFWHQINLFYHQLDGLSTGYDYTIKRTHNDIEIGIEDFIWMNSFTDVATIERVFNITNGAHPVHDLPGLASAFIRLVPDQPADKGPTKERLIVAHNTVGNYNTMLRIMKRYKLHYHKNVLPSSATVPGKSIVFTGFPAAISSQDDMYCVSGDNDHRITVTGTAINNFNPELWAKVNLVDHALIGPRVMAANRLSNSGMDWVRFIARVNSGTAHSQWSILNLAKLAYLNASTAPAPVSSFPSPENSLYRFVYSTIEGELKSLNFSLWRSIRRRVWSKGAPNLLWTAEQIPGLTHAADQSIVLRAKGYWADYGIPHYQDIRELSGIKKKMEGKNGEIYSLISSPRAILFKNDFETATDVDSVMELMRSNHHVNKSINSDILALIKDNEENGEIEPDDIVSNSNVDDILKSLKTVKSHVEDGETVASMLTKQEQDDITSQVNEIIKQLSLANSGESSDRSSSESLSKEDLNMEQNSVEEIDDKQADEGAWHGLGARGDLHGWLGEEIYGLLPLGVIDTKVFNTTTDGSSDLIAISGPVYSQTLDKPIEYLLNSDIREKAQFSLSELLQKFRQNSLRFISDEQSESDEKEPENSEEKESTESERFEEALYSVVNSTIQIYAHDGVPPFEWSESDFSKISHSGHPNKWRFDPVPLTWVW